MSDDVDNYDMSTSSSSSSGASTPVHDGKSGTPQTPVYAVTVTDPVKNGDVIQYTVKTTKLSDGSELTVVRDYHDFEYLHHCLMTQNPNDGIIVSCSHHKCVQS